MNKVQKTAASQFALAVAMMLVFGAQAQAVLTDFYNGATGDANPVSQGWAFDLFDLGNASSQTPDPDEDRVHMLTSASGLNKYKLPLSEFPQQIIDAVSDDVYVWEVEVQVKSPELADADGEPRHSLSDWDVITGTNNGSVGFRDRFFFETTDYVSGTERIRFTGAWFPTGNFSQTIRPHREGTDPQPWTNFTSIYDRNVYRFERDGLGLDTVKFFINGDLVFQGAGGTSPIGNTQVEIRDNATEITNLYWHRFSVDVDAVAPSCDFNADSNCNEVDIDLLADAVRNGTSDSQFNVDGLGDPNIPDDADFDFYITDDSMLSTGLGDHDLNMIVNFNDFVVLSNNFGVTPTGWGQGNGNTDETTNFNDFVRLSNNFGMNFASDSNVPEPATLVVLGLAVMAGIRRFS